MKRESVKREREFMVSVHVIGWICRTGGHTPDLLLPDNMSCGDEEEDEPGTTPRAALGHSHGSKVALQ